jgi:drug/metabolite transporter (DMT)-like permease
MQMMAGAVLTLVLAFALGEHRAFSWDKVTPVSALAIAYLLVFGALVGFSAYLWLMRVSTPSRVATHAYVNPVVAVLLGWAVAGEHVSGMTLVAMSVIVAAVVLIVSAPRRAAKEPEVERMPRSRPAPAEAGAARPVGARSRAVASTR